MRECSNCIDLYSAVRLSLTWLSIFSLSSHNLIIICGGLTLSLPYLQFIVFLGHMYSFVYSKLGIWGHFCNIFFSYSSFRNSYSACVGMFHGVLHDPKAVFIFFLSLFFGCAKQHVGA